MKKILCMVLTIAMLCGLTACGSEKSPELPEDSVVKADVQEYITEMLDENAEIDIFEKTEVEESDDSLVITCNVLYSGDAGENQGEFELTYAKDGDEWVLSKCRVNLDEEVTEAAEPEEEEKQEEEKENVSSDVEMSDELFDFTFELDGAVYQLPFDYSQLTDNGWTISYTGYSEDTTLPANSYEYFTMSKNGSEIWVYVINLSGNAKVVKDCKVGGVEVSHRSLMDADLFSIANGINTLSNLDDVTAAFGNANDTSSYDDYTYLTYENGDYVDAQFTCYNEDAEYQNNQIRLRNFVSDESDVTETSTEVPEYLATYVEPTELGDDLLSCNIELEGDLYHLPAPVSAFTDNGWAISSKPNAVGAGNTDYITLEKDGERLSVSIINYAEYQTIPENCAVYSVYVYDTDNVSVTLPGNLTLDSDKAEAEALLTEDFSYYKGTYSHSYDYSDYDSGISIGVDIDIETEKVSQVSVSSKAWFTE